MEKVFSDCKNAEDRYKLGLVYFVEWVLLGSKKNVGVNLDDLHLVDNLVMFEEYY